MKINAALAASVFFLISCSTSQQDRSSTNSLHSLYSGGLRLTTHSSPPTPTNDDGLVKDKAILNVGNYELILSSALSQPNARTKLDHDEQIAGIDLLSLSIKDSLVFEKFSSDNESDVASGSLEVEAIDGSYIKLNADTGNPATFMTTVITSTLIISFEQSWSALLSDHCADTLTSNLLTSTSCS